MKGVFANVALKAKTLILAGGQFVSHWEYLAIMRRVDPASVSTWLRIEDPHLKGPRKSHALWFIPSRANPPVAALYEFVVGETGVTTTAEPNLHIVWSVFADKGFSSSSRILYYVARYLNVGTRLHAPPLMRFIQDPRFQRRMRWKPRPLSLDVKFVLTGMRFILLLPVTHPAMVIFMASLRWLLSGKDVLVVRKQSRWPAW